MSRNLLSSRELEMRRILENIDDIKRYAESIVLAQGRVRDSLFVLLSDSKRVNAAGE